MNNLTRRLSDAINNLGNDLTAAGWPSGEKDGREYDTRVTFRELAFYSGIVIELQANLHDCVNELCQQCGQYRQEHKGACDDCRWKDVRHHG